MHISLEHQILRKLTASIAGTQCVWPKNGAKGDRGMHKPGVSRFRQCLLHQGRLEQFFQEVIEQSGRIKVDRNVKTLKLRLNDKTLSSSSTEEYPIALKVQKRWPDSAIAPEALPVFSPNGLQIIHAKYLR